MINVIVEIASIEDVSGIYDALKQNLIEIKDFNQISEEQKAYLNKYGYLRKEVKKDFYEKLIKDAFSEIYVAKDQKGTIVGFASIYKKKHNIANFRSTLDNLYTDDPNIKELLTSEKKEFAYLDQISVIPKFKRKGIGTAIMNKILAEIKLPIVAFIVNLPLGNKASTLWHEHNGFKIAATCDGDYKGQKFEWSIYIHWNNSR